MRYVEAFEDRVRLLMRRAGLAAVPPSVAGGVVVLAVVALVWAGWRWWPREQAAGGFAPVAAAAEADPSAAAGGEATRVASVEPSASVLVHVVGAVRHPGVYELAAGSRASDAVDAAGGLLPDAVPEAVNLAREVTDGEQLAVPDRDAVAAGLVAGAGAGSAGAAGGAAGGQPSGAVVDLNSADAAALDALPGVGPATAARIISDREANGPFASVEDLGRVSGIGPKKLEQLAGLVCVR